jgi:hypothetical protein
MSVDYFHEKQLNKRLAQAPAAERKAWEQTEQDRLAELEAEKEQSRAENAAIRGNYLAGLEQQKAERQKQDEAQEARERTEKETGVKARYRLSYLQAGGSPEGFDKAWPKMYEDWLAEETRHSLDDLKNSLKSLYR